MSAVAGGVHQPVGILDDDAVAVVFQSAHSLSKESLCSAVDGAHFGEIDDYLLAVRDAGRKTGDDGFRTREPQLALQFDGGDAVGFAQRANGGFRRWEGRASCADRGRVTTSRTPQPRGRCFRARSTGARSRQHPPDRGARP